MPSTCRWLVPCFGLGTLQCPKWMCSSCWIPYGGFLKWGYPCSSSIYRWDFPQKKTSSYWGSPMSGPIFLQRQDSSNHVSPCFAMFLALLRLAGAQHSGAYGACPWAPIPKEEDPVGYPWIRLFSSFLAFSKSSMYFLSIKSEHQ